MSKTGLIIDTLQLDNLNSALALYPRELTNAIKASLKGASMAALKTVVPKHYAIKMAKLSGTHRITNAPYDANAESGLRFEVSGRRLTPAHFEISPLRNLAPRPMLEIIKGSVKQAGEVKGADGKNKVPFVMFTRGKAGKHINVFIGTGRKQQKNPEKEALRSYRTVSVPQMLGNEAVADEVQEIMLSVFERDLMKQVEKKTQLMADNIVKGVSG